MHSSDFGSAREYVTLGKGVEGSGVTPGQFGAWRGPGKGEIERHTGLKYTERSPNLVVREVRWCVFA